MTPGSPLGLSSFSYMQDKPRPPSKATKTAVPISTSYTIQHPSGEASVSLKAAKGSSYERRRHPASAGWKMPSATICWRSVPARHVVAACRVFTSFPPMGAVLEGNTRKGEVKGACSMASLAASVVGWEAQQQ